jgi:predicted dehydrogenase
MKTIKAAVIGTGFIGPAHVEALRRLNGVDVVAIASNDPRRAQQIAQHYSIPKYYETWEAVVNDGMIDVVHNCTPNNLHFEINKAVVEAGKHIVSEKPLTLTSQESAYLVELVRNHNVVNAVNFNYRFYPLIQHARAMVSSGEIGDIYLVHGHYLQDWLYYDTDYNWRLESKLSGSSRAVADIGSHWCDLVQFISGLGITSVCAELSTVHSIRKRPTTIVETFKGKESGQPQEYEDIDVDTEDAGIVMFRLANEAIGVFTASQVSAGRKNREWFEIDGSKKALSWNQEEPNKLWVGYRERSNEIMIKDPSLMIESTRKYAHYPGGHPEGYPDGMKNLFMNVYDFIRSGEDPKKQKPDFPTFEDGHWENIIVEAVQKSDENKQWVDIK